MSTWKPVYKGFVKDVDNGKFPHGLWLRDAEGNVTLLGDATEISSACGDCEIIWPGCGCCSTSGGIVAHYCEVPPPPAFE